MNINEVIKYPVLTEKSELMRSDKNVYTFVVDKRTNKVEVKKAVEYIFDVKVLKVNIINYDKKPAKLGRYAGFKNAVKKAIVYLDKNSKIILFANEAKEALKEDDKQKNDEKVNEAKTETNVVEEKAEKVLSEVEQKAAAKIKQAEEKKEAKDAE